MAREMLVLDLIERSGNEVRHPFENRGPGENEVLVRRIVGITGLIQIQQIHAWTFLWEVRKKATGASHR
jgi:hypothetical protein